MIIGIITYDGELDIKVISNKYKSVDYRKDLHYFIGYQECKRGPGNIIWQQDNCRVHTASWSMEWLEEHGIPILKWPSRSPDLNIIENVWKQLQDYVYEKGQFRTKKELVDAIFAAKDRLLSERPDYIKSLYDNFHKRIVKVIQGRGDETGY